MATDIDFSRKQAEAGVWSLVELNFGILCNNLMRLKPFLRAYLPKLLTILGLSSDRSSKPQGGESSKGAGYWRGGKPAHSYQLRSLEEGSSKTKNKTDADGFGHAGSDEAESHQNGSTDSIFRT